ncbi:conserved hypothetical protein [Ricinus communis]|uniref:Secreted protein n=1 Tax=Ricinus communis TaxID=3988 RepID=B9TAK5_RICCO|nr:conserved hypothetical protein [Ricinus communis]
MEWNWYLSVLLLFHRSAHQLSQGSAYCWNRRAYQCSFSCFGPDPGVIMPTFKHRDESRLHPTLAHLDQSHSLDSLSYSVLRVSPTGTSPSFPSSSRILVFKGPTSHTDAYESQVRDERWSLKNDG